MVKISLNKHRIHYIWFLMVIVLFASLYNEMQSAIHME